MFKKLLSLTIIICFFLTTLGPLPKAHADTVLGLPAPGTMVSVSPSFEPALIRGLTVHKDNPFLFDFIVDPGDEKTVIPVSSTVIPAKAGIQYQEQLKVQAERMIKYFFAALTIPDKDVWVNLSPYEKDRMIPASLGVTAMGRDLLAQDYMLKQLTASLIYPQKALGKTFWNRVYSKAKEMYGTTQIPVNTFNKVWIVPQRVGVYEHGQTAFIVNGHLKVMLEEDYLSIKKHTVETRNNVNSIGSQIIRAIVLPEIEKEVNDGKNFATLRQIFYAQALAVWFKRNLKQALLNRVYANKGTVKGIDQNDAATNEAIYHQYLRAYKKGVFNYIKEDIDPVTQETLPRKYFSGGFGDLASLSIVPAQPTVADEAGAKEDVDFAVLAATSKGAAQLDAAMLLSPRQKIVSFLESLIPAGVRGKFEIGQSESEIWIVQSDHHHRIFHCTVTKDGVEFSLLTLDFHTTYPNALTLPIDVLRSPDGWSKIKEEIGKPLVDKWIQPAVDKYRRGQELAAREREEIRRKKEGLKAFNTPTDAAMTGVAQDELNKKNYLVLESSVLALAGGVMGLSWSLNRYPNVSEWEIAVPFVVAMYGFISTELNFAILLDKILLDRNKRLERTSNFRLAIKEYNPTQFSPKLILSLGDLANVLKGQSWNRVKAESYIVAQLQDELKKRKMDPKEFDHIFGILHSQVQEIVGLVYLADAAMAGSNGEKVNSGYTVTRQKSGVSTQYERIHDVVRDGSGREIGVRTYNPALYNKVPSAQESAREVLGRKDRAMVRGGIDLSQQDAALHVEKDANGGVKVNVDPSLIARIEREGMPEVVPVIINMQPVDAQSLFRS